jgi:hypothetical protein
MMPWFGRMFDHAEYQLSFQIAAVFPVVGWGLWRLLEPMKLGIDRSGVRLR